jgi:hypothetical protein
MNTVCIKKSYQSKTQAKKDTKGYRKPYLCPTCKMWHTTFVGKGGKKKTKKEIKTEKRHQDIYSEIVGKEHKEKYYIDKFNLD